MLATSIYILSYVIEFLRQFFIKKMAGDWRFDENAVRGNKLS
jgi:hypothetical protein